MPEGTIQAAETVGLALGGIVVTLLGLMIWFYPGPVALSDRLPFGLLFLIPGVLLLGRLYGTR